MKGLEKMFEVDGADGAENMFVVEEEAENIFEAEGADDCIVAG